MLSEGVRVTPQPDLIFCHCDISQSDIIVNPETLKAEASLTGNIEATGLQSLRDPIFVINGLRARSSGMIPRMISLRIPLLAEAPYGIGRMKAYFAMNTTDERVNNGGAKPGLSYMSTQ